MFKVNNKYTRTIPGVVVVFSLLTLNIFHTVSIDNFEQVIVNWVNHSQEKVFFKI